MKILPAKLTCSIEDEDGSYTILVSIVGENGSTLLESSDITKEVNDYIQLNEYYKFYENEKDLLDDLEEGNLQRTLGRIILNDRLDALISIRAKMLHQQGLCDHSCILCNSSLGDDPFPDFLFDLRNLEPLDEV